MPEQPCKKTTNIYTNI